MANKNNEKEIYCSFCGKPQELVGRLIAGNGVYICDQCVDLCMNILEQTEELENTAVDAELAKKMIPFLFQSSLSLRKSRKFLMNM